MNQNPIGGGSSAQGAPAQGGEDYLDKALDAVEKKFGGAKYGDPSRNRAMNEKITDAIRNFFEKITGKKVPAKFSN
ncbi:hypothetical protein MMC34_004015 [Xylographa carneopallida]|nr:hypothetical protein [Xylographa carneopallida]